MEELPHIVHQRLKGNTNIFAADHPDADLLTAFAEQTLGERERAHLMLHLANCAECREILSLATAESDALPAPSVATSRLKASWFSFSLLRWGTAAALAVIIGAAVMLRDQHKYAATVPGTAVATLRGEQRTDEDLAKRTPSPALNQTPAAPPSSGNFTALTVEARKLPEAKKLTGKRDEVSGANALIAGMAASPVAKAQAKPFAYDSEPSSSSTVADLRERNVPDLDQKQSTGIAGSNPPAPSTNLDTVAAYEEPIPGKAKEEISSATTAAKLGAATGGAVAANKPGEYGQAINGRNPAVGTASETVEVTAASPAIAITSQNSLAKARINIPAPRWTISAGGELERSLDSGKTWDKVPVSTGATFRAFSVIGAELWVGGAKGALFHSSDAGQHWTQVTPVAQGTGLSSDIDTIEFVDRQHGKVGTTTGETWTTPDAGQTWQKH
jgi:hypothetical protein